MFIISYKSAENYLNSMPIPDYHAIMLPLLKFASDKKEHSFPEAINYISDKFDLTAEERKQRSPSGNIIIDNRVAWALTYLKKAGILQPTRRSYFIITERGNEVLKQNLQNITSAFLRQYSEFKTFQSTTREKEDKGKVALSDFNTPEELIDEGYQKIRRALADDLLKKVKASPPSFFEKLVVDLLLNMGYGGSKEDAGTSLGQAGDEGLDGVIKEDKLGLDAIYIQAKRWDNGTVGRPEIQKFVGALQGKKARKGIFITTSKFSQDAIDYAKNIDPKIVLIDGEQLSQLMIDHDVGVADVLAYKIKRIDSDYFPE